MVRSGERLPKTDRRAQIYRAAARIFFEKGYSAASVEDIAEEVGILKGSLYYYMDSKEDLLFHVIDEAHTGLSRQLEAQEDESISALDELSRLIHVHVRYVCVNHTEIGVFFNDFRFLSKDRKRVIIAHRDSYDHRLQRIIRRGQTSGEIRDTIDPKIASLGILGMVNWLYQWYRAGGDMNPDEIADELLGLVQSGLAAS